MSDKGANNSQNSNKHSRGVYLAAVIAGLGGVLFGYDTGVISGAILFIREDFSLSSFTVELVVSSMLLGAVIGAICGGMLVDRFGRQRMIIIAAAVFALGSIAAAISPVITWLIISRIVVGLALGVSSLTVPLYISELSPAHIRGRLVSINQLAIACGIVISYLVDYALSDMRGWRWMLGLAAIPAVILGVGMLWMPESPRWLVSRDSMDKARAVLQRLRGKENVDKDLKKIHGKVKAMGGGWSELFKPLVRPALIVGVALAIFQQVTGINTVIYYAPTIFKFAGFQAASTSILATASVGVVNAILTFVALLLLDRVGRRPLLLVGLAGMVLGLGVLGLAFQLSNLANWLGWIAIGSLMLYVSGFAIGLGPVFWLLISEIYPLRVRGLATSVSTTFNWGANMLVTLTFLSLVHAIGRPWTFWLYGLIGIGAWVFVWFWVPETKGRSLEEIEDHWQSGKSAREMGG